ncbi:cupin [Alkalihalophilus lindianensis]|uniref:Cupin n=1 Tax=Alkalihalophilus lindianensis TaxID=1630542 RepID=A0ABU3X4W7_9BACI|nr:cupin [Alkalihalophilus lindianensis]MDV2682925.1 cupin [Alkalihalophilus lindianensis]
MIIYRFDKEVGKQVTHFDSNFIMSKISRLDQPVQIGCMYLEEGGLIGFHQATVPQLLLIIEGEGWVRSDIEEKVKVQKGDAVFWEKGEGHETGTHEGLVAIAIESEALNPSEFMVERG